jgi:hypothetical protein
MAKRSKPVRRPKQMPGMKPRHVQRRKRAWRQSKHSSVLYVSRVRGGEPWGLFDEKAVADREHLFVFEEVPQGAIIKRAQYGIKT